MHSLVAGMTMLKSWRRKSARSVISAFMWPSLVDIELYLSGSMSNCGLIYSLPDSQLLSSSGFPNLGSKCILGSGSSGPFLLPQENTLVRAFPCVFFLYVLVMMLWVRDGYCQWKHWGSAKWLLGPGRWASVTMQLALSTRHFSLFFQEPREEETNLICPLWVSEQCFFF